MHLSQHQLLVLIFDLLEKYISTGYRDFAELIDLMSNVKEKLDLAKITHSLIVKSSRPEPFFIV